MARPKKYATAAERQAAFRQRYATLSVRVQRETADTIADISRELDEPQTEVINSLIIFALLNRNWRVLGLTGKRLPRAPNPIEDVTP